MRNYGYSIPIRVLEYCEDRVISKRITADKLWKTKKKIKTNYIQLQYYYIEFFKIREELPYNTKMADIDNNPFAALLKRPDAGDGISKRLVEDIFLITLCKEPITNRALLCLADLIVQDSSNDSSMSEDLLSHLIFERIMITDKDELRKYLLTGKREDRSPIETEAVTYLYGAYLKCNEYASQHPSDCEKIRNLILTNASTCIRQPELFQGSQTASVHLQWLKLLKQSDEIENSMQEFLIQVVQKVIADNEDDIESLGALKAIFYPLLGELQKEIMRETIITMKKNTFCALSYFVRDKRAPQLGELLIDYTTPNPDAKGGDYVDTLFGQLLSISIMPKNNNGPYEFFADITLGTQQIDASLWNFLSLQQNATFQIFKQLLVLSPTTKRKILQWISQCLHTNLARGHLWNSLNVSLEQLLNQNASDSFMIGLTSVLLRLSAPLCKPQLKIALVDPTYCAVTENERAAKQVSIVKAYEETCLLPVEENEIRLTAESFNFVTELFYMTHKSFELSYRACIEKFTRMTREMHNLQVEYQNVATQNPNSDLANNLLRMLKQQMQPYLCLQNSLMEPTNDEMLFKFFEASSIWLTQIAIVSEKEFELALAQKNFAPRDLQDMEIPTNISFVPSYLKSVPENIIDNIVAYLNFSRHFENGRQIGLNPSMHDAFFKMIILFMGNEKLVKNPHLRAKLAEALEFFLPRRNSTSSHSSFVTYVFESHADRSKVVRSLLNVFVSIEMTGQSVQFEQKFNYRRPMYAIMEYLWTKEDQIQCFRDLATEAEENMEAIEPPLFLRFINLLINDAIFLLDESLSNLEQIRQLQEAQSRGEWESLPHNERQQQISNLHHLGSLTRFDNILGRDTINILKLLTSEIRSIFCHNSMVDRIAAMLNYFLLSLVGPHKERFKVKDKKEFEFDPAQTVFEICNIYINLSSSDRFCLAVSQDGRSYSDQLFTYADTILTRIGGGQLIGDMSEFAAKVQKMETQYKEEQEFIADAPDEYLDPIMSTLMTDPVILPSSKVTVDRCTIARHLLSDQTDPFNRAPLTMDKVKPDERLKAEIEKWIADKRDAGRTHS